MEFSRQEYWSGLPFPPTGDLPDPGIEPESPETLVLASKILYHCQHLESPYKNILTQIIRRESHPLVCGEVSMNRPMGGKGMKN